MRPIVGQRAPDLAGDGVEAGHDLLLVRLVGEVGHAGAALGVVAHGAREQHDRTAIRPDGPVVDLGDRQRRRREREPRVVVACRRRVV